MLWYNEKRDGKLENYLIKHDGCNSFPLFKGYRHFKMLWNRGYLIPDFSVIRIMWNIGRGDEHYLVKNEASLEGLEVPVHFGKSGIHKVKNILNNKCPSWEAQHLAVNPVSRNSR